MFVCRGGNGRGGVAARHEHGAGARICARDHLVPIYQEGAAAGPLRRRCGHVPLLLPADAGTPACLRCCPACARASPAILHAHARRMHTPAREHTGRQRTAKARFESRLRQSRAHGGPHPVCRVQGGATFPNSRRLKLSAPLQVLQSWMKTQKALELRTLVTVHSAFLTGPRRCY